MCFSNANFGDIYLNGSLRSHNRFQIPINLGVFECLSSGRDSCLGLGDTSGSQQLACLMQRGSFNSRLNDKVMALENKKFELLLLQRAQLL